MSTKASSRVKLDGSRAPWTPSDGRPSRLGRAIAELGQVPKTLHLLGWIDGEELRRETGVGLNRHESRHSVAPIIFHGNRGQLRQPYRDGQTNQLGVLGFALTAHVLWNAQYLDDAVAQLRATGHQITDEDLARLSPRTAALPAWLDRYNFIRPHGSLPKAPGSRLTNVPGNYS